jgi:hypothetical protein
MTITSEIANVRPVTVVFAQCFDATTFGRTVFMTEAEEGRLRSALLALRNIGLVLPATFEPVAADYGFRDVVDHLRATLGSQIADLALATAPPIGNPAPAALMPVWAFEPEGETEDVLLSSGMLWAPTC